MTSSQRQFQTFSEFYPFYLGEHTNQTCRRLHIIGTTLVIALAITVLITRHWIWLWWLPVLGYGFAWIGHFFFEKNRPATFKNPLYSLLGDFVMWKDVVTGKIPW